MSEHEQCIEIFNAKNQIPINLDPTRAALIVVDMQRYFTQPSFPFTDAFEKMSPGIGAGYFQRLSDTVIPSIQRLLNRFREAGATIVFTAVGTETKDSMDLPGWLRSFDDMGLGTLGTKIWPPVGDSSWMIDPVFDPQPGELVINKRSAGAFATTDLEGQLRARNIDAVVVTGVATDVCVSTTAREAADRNFKVVVVSDACTTISDQLHKANLQSLYVFGWVRSADEVVELLQAPSAVSATP